MFQVRVFYPQKELGEYWPCCPQTMTHRSIIHILQQLKDVSSTHSAGLKMHWGPLTPAREWPLSTQRWTNSLLFKSQIQSSPSA